MKVKITAVEMFNVNIGDCELGPFRCASTWNNMMELVNDVGHKIIVERPGAFSSVLAEMMGDAQEVTVIQASPHVLGKMIEDEAGKVSKGPA